MDWKRKEYWVVFSLIGLTAIYSNLVRSRRMVPTRPFELSKIPLEVGDWVGREYPLSSETLETIKAESTTLRRYANSSGNEIWLYVAYWASQKYGAQPHSPIQCLPGNGWYIVSRKLTSLPTDKNDVQLSVNMGEITNGKSTEIMLYWYQTQSGVLIKELSLKFDLAQNALVGNLTDAAFVRITTPLLNTDEASGLRLIRNFWSLVGKDVEKALPF